MVEPRRPIPCQVSPSRHTEWCRLLEAQHGVIAVEQLRSFSVGRNAITANLHAGRWRQVAPRVYATFTGPLSQEVRIAAALCYAGPEAILSHQTAAELWGMVRAVPGPVHVTVPYHCSAVSLPSLVIVHRSRAIRHIVVSAVQPLTSRADTVIDMAVAELSERAAMKQLTSLITDRQVATVQVREQLELRPPRRYRVALMQALNRIDQGVQSPLEELYAVDVEIAHGIPAARRQEPFLVDGRRLVEDAVYDNIGVPVTVRLDGSRHLLPEVALRDRRRGNVAALAGRTCLVFGWDELRDNPCRYSAEVAQALWGLGWQGPLRTCPRCS